MMNYQGRPLSILLIEDDADDVLLIQAYLEEAGRNQFQLKSVATLAAGLQYLAEASPAVDIVLLDLMLPDSLGIHTLQQLVEAVPHLPIILMTGLADETIGAEALREGAQDYLLKDQLDSRGLVRAIRYAIERKTATAQLQLQSHALEAAANAITILDARGNIEWCNPAFTELTGYTLEEVRGKNPRVLKSGVHPPEFYADMWKTVLSGQVWHSELVNRRKDGLLYTEEMTITPVRDGRGQISHFIAIKQNVTERKVNEEALRQSETRFRLLIESAPAAILTVDSEGRILAVNAQTLSWFGYSPEELIGQPVDDLLPHARREIHRQKRQQYMSRPFPWPAIAGCEGWASRKDGTFFPIEISLNPVSLEDDFEVIAIVQDISSRKQAEEALSRQSLINSTMAALSQALIGSASLEEIALMVQQEGVTLTGSDFGVVGYIDPVYDRLILPKSAGLSGDGAKIDVEAFRAGFQRFGAQIRQMRGPALVNQLSEAPHIVEILPDSVPVRRLVGTSALIDNTMVGIVVFFNAQRDYTEQDVAIVERLASLYALAVMQRRAEESLQEMNRQLFLINQISRRLVGVRDEAALFDDLLRSMQAALSCYQGTVWLYQGESLYPAAFRGNAEKPTQPGALVAQALAGGALVLQAGPPPMVAVPIGNQERRLGVLELEGGDLLHAGVEMLLQAVSDQLALALEGARLFAELKVQRDEALDVTQSLMELTDRVVGMNRGAMALLGARTPQEVAQNLVVHLRDEMGVQKSAVWLIESEGIQLAAAMGLDPEVLAEWQTPEAKCPGLERVYQTGHGETRSSCPRGSYCTRYFQNCRLLPVRVQNEVLGIVITEWDTMDDDILRMFINEVALALFATRSYQQLQEKSRILATTNYQLSQVIKSKTELLNFMSHEVRNPLTAIIGFASLLQKARHDPLTTKQAYFVTQILNSSRHMADLVNEILDLSKVEAGKMELHYERVDLQAFCQDILGMVSGRAEDHGLVLKLEIADPVPALEADPLRLRQILLNLLTNAIKFTPSGGVVTLHARDGVRLDEADAVAIGVTDTGIGIRSEDMPKLFSEFEQIDSVMGRKEVGTGLGLPLTRKLVEMHRGRITVESVFNEGTTFTVWLPAAAS